MQGGRRGASDELDSVECLHSGREAWVIVAALTLQRTSLTAAAMDGAVYAIGGQVRRCFVTVHMLMTSDNTQALRRHLHRLPVLPSLRGPQSRTQDVLLKPSRAPHKSPANQQCRDMRRAGWQAGVLVS